MKELMQFEGNKVNIIQDERDELLFELYSTGMALGYVKSNGKSGGVQSVHPNTKTLFPFKSRIDKVVENAEITPCVHNGHKYINESQLYDFMLEARTDKCRKFRKWVTNDVLPSIRKTGSYTAPSKPIAPEIPDYKYIDKTYHARPVLSAMDICNLFHINSVNLYQFMNTRLITNTDFNLLQGDDLKNYLNENPSIPRCRKSVYIIYRTGLIQIISYFGLDTKEIPKIMTERRGYVVQDGVRQLMEYVRRELKGIEALTYLVESNDTPSNLENYRKTLVRKLSALNWWQIDVDTIKLGIHTINNDEFCAIHRGEYGIKF